DEGKRLFRQLHHGPDAPAVDGDVGKNRSRREVVVPQIVSYELVMPHALPGLALDGNQRVREQIVAGTMAAIHVARRTGERQIRVPELLVDADERPEVGMPRVLPRVVLPRIDAELSAARDDMKCPAQLPGANVIAPHVARCSLFARRRVAHRRANDDDVPAHAWRATPRVRVLV